MRSKTSQDNPKRVRYSMRIPEELRTRLERIAKQDKRSLSYTLIMAGREYAARREANVI